MDSVTKLKTLNNLAQAKIFKKRAPLAVGWALTYICNLSCHYCRRWNQKTNEVTTVEARGMIDKLRKLGLARINFTGGEPLIRKDVGELIDYAKSKKICVWMNSNGTYVPKFIKSIKKLDGLALSVEGPDFIHDVIRKKGSYQEVLEAAEAAQKEGIVVKFAATLNKHNLDYVDDLIKLAKKFNTFVTFQPLEGNRLGSKEKNPIMPDKDLFRDSVNKIISYKKSTLYKKHVGNSFNSLEYFLDYPKVKHLECAFGRIAFRIEPDGRMGPCALLSSKKLAIDLRRIDIKNIKKEFNNIFLPDTKCSCGFCCNRIELNMIWNMKFQSMTEALRI